MGVDLLDDGEQRSHQVHPPMNIALATPLFVLAGAIVILSFARFLINLQHRRRLRAIIRDEDQEKFTQRSGLMASLNKHVFYAPILSTRHSREFRLGKIHMGTVPLRIETILLTGYIGVNLAFFVSLIDWWKDYQEVLYQLKYAAGHLAVMNTPGLVLTAGRNNPLIPLLGTQFDAFNLIHRWVGRLVVVGSIVHVSCVVVARVAESSMQETANAIWHIPFFIYGMVAFIAFLLILIQSVSPLRHAFYEVFLHLHILLAVAAFVGLWYHVRGLTQQYVLLATIVLWGLERAARLLSLIWRNWGKQHTVANVELLPGNVARVNVALARTWKFKPGQYMYLYVPKLGLWTSHPFSVAWTASEENTIADKRDSSDSFNLLLDEKQRPTVSFLIKRRDGFTCKLLRKAMDADERQFRATAFAEGPFGGLHSLSSYGTVLLVAGGIGITHPISYLHEFVEGFSARTIAVRKMSLIWVIRSLDHLSWIHPWIVSLFDHPSLRCKPQHPYQPQGLSLSIQIHVTDAESSGEEYMSDESPWALTAPPGVTVSIGFGKPCFGHIVETAKKSQVGAMAVSVCGPGKMGDDVRQSVRMAQDSRTVDLYEETFTW
ncbi:ferric reductase like transmembrane component-domain-containing protein [Aspergillus pseudodeflectus]|uniref:ferric-chelate reductase (NADPH) n=1 Tax=Aspergillus pseudodeflectus TaxID=176178 RepID=A0ABR4KVM3_9EURO